MEKYKSVETEQGLEISINGKTICSGREAIIDSEMIHPYKNVIVEDNSKITILAGITHSGFTGKGSPSKAGWYIYCNGRLVVYADKTGLTGWGNEFRQYHNSFAMFRGYVYFESADLLSLPWNTTKTGVDVYNRLYVLALEEMKNASNQIFTQVEQLRTRYDVQNLEEIRVITQQKEIPITYSLISNIESGNDFEINIPDNIVELTNVTFSLDKNLFDLIKKRTGAKTKKEFGTKLVEYYCDMEEIEYGGQ